MPETVRIKEKIGRPDIEVSKLKLLKSNHQSQQFRMQDDIMTHFPEKVLSGTERLIAGLKVDEKTVSDNPHPADGFSGMEVNGSVPGVTRSRLARTMLEDLQECHRARTCEDRKLPWVLDVIDS